MNLPRKRAPTIRDVALAAGVSTATVSKFVNGSQRFSAEVEARIGQAVTQLGWSLHPMARGMNTGLTGNVGIVLQDIRNPHFKSMVKGTAREAAKVQMNLIAADAAESREPELAVLKALSRRVDGLIVSARLPPPVIQALLEGSTPVVFYGGPPQRVLRQLSGRTHPGRRSSPRARCRSRWRTMRRPSWTTSPMHPAIRRRTRCSRMASA